jgi:ATP adenylyltransferase
MDRLWAPWRMSYISGIDKKDEGCVFCAKPQQTDDLANLVLTRGALAYVIMNLYPYNNGHLMVVPYLHTSKVEELDSAAIAEMWQLCQKSIAVLREAFHPEGFNIGLNVGRVAGAGIDQHLHLHIVPRWNGDTNFMPVTGQTKVISQSLEDAYDALQPLYQSIG